MGCGAVHPMMMAFSLAHISNLCHYHLVADLEPTGKELGASVQFLVDESHHHSCH